MAKTLKMDKYIQRSLKIVKGDLETDENSLIHAVQELKNRADELHNVFHEVKSKGWNMKDIDSELNEEWNEITIALIKPK